MRTWARWRGVWQCVHTEAAGSKQDHYILSPTLSRLQLTRYYLCCIKITNSARHPSCYWVQFNRFEDINLCIGDGRASGRSSLNILYLCKRRPWLIMLFSCRMCFEYWTWISQSISGGAGGVATPSSSQLVICIQDASPPVSRPPVSFLSFPASASTGDSAIWKVAQQNVCH